MVRLGANLTASVIEMQGILIELLEKFEFSPAPGNPEIIRMASVLVHPM